MSGYIHAMRRYFDFAGRSSRSEFWFFVLFVMIFSVVAMVLDAALLGSEMQGVGILSGIVSLVHLIPSIAVSVRRLHDIDRTGWWLLINLVPTVLFLVVLGGSLAMLLGGENAGAGLMTLGFGGALAGLVALVVWIVLLVFYVTPGTLGPNRFGPPPEV